VSSGSFPQGFLLGNPVRVPRAVLFDVYGTLLLQVPRVVQSVKDFIRRNRLQLTPEALPLRRCRLNESGESFFPTVPMGSCAAWHSATSLPATPAGSCPPAER